VPWAGDASISFLSTPEETRANLAEAGFKEVVWEDASEESIAWWKERFAAAEEAGGAPALGLYLLLGREAPRMSRNLLRNLEERRVVVVRGVFDLA